MSAERDEPVRSPPPYADFEGRMVTSKPDYNSFHRQSSELTFLASNCASPQTLEEINGSSSDTLSGDSWLRAPLHLQLPHDDENRGADPKYYRVAFKGVVALLEAPMFDASRTGSFLSYGEIFTASRVDNTTDIVRVESVLTGGYTLDASSLHNLGYLLLRQNNTTIADILWSTPQCDTGTFHYQVLSTTPLPILTGPSLDAPKTRAVVLPKSIQEVSVRLRLEDEMDLAICFLRLSHRRGWIADRKIGPKSKSYVAVVKEVQYDVASDILSTDGSSSITSTSTSRSFPTMTRHRPPRKRRDASNKDADKALKTIHGKSVIVPVKQMHDISDRSNAPSSNVSIMSDDSSHTQPSLSIVHSAHPASRDSSFSASQSVTSTNHSSGAQSQAMMRNFYLMRVTAPRGLKILDAPQFQVNRLIRSGKLHQGVSSSHMVSQVESHGPKLHHSIFQTMSGRLTTTGPSQSGNPAVFDSTTKTRVLPCGVLFESSTRMEITGSFSDGEGLIKLSDGSGWAIVPRRNDLDQQYRGISVGRPGGNEEQTGSFEEVGSASLETINDNHDQKPSGTAKTTWLRVMTRAGVTVSCPPPVQLENDDETSPTSSRGSSAINGSNHGSKTEVFPSNESDVASSVGSAFLDAMFRTPKKREPDLVKETIPRSNPDRPSQGHTIPCGTFLEVERWADTCAATSCGREYARLCGGQGWVPLTVAGKPSTARISRPEFRCGSFWFRVQSSRGLKVRLGPSTRAPSIKSDDGVYFRFECGEFLRASEVVTLCSEQREHIESFVKLYRNRHARLHLGNDDVRTMASLTAQAEWVQAYMGQDLFLEECASEPRIERHRQGWRYNVLPEDGVAVRKGPSFASEKTGVILFGGESVVVNERVTPSGDVISWLRMKDGQGWIHDVNDEGEHVVIAHSLRHRALTSRPRKPGVLRDGTDISYNDIIARLFHSEDSYRPRQEDGVQL